MKKTWSFVLLVLALSIPTFFQMIRPGIFSMQDFHYFRLVEFDKCVRDLQIPCRWAGDSGALFGEPLFNFYGQFVYAFGEIMHLIGASLVDSLKLTFIFSLVGSSAAMFFLARKIWKDNLAAIVSSIIYLYAPYRAVDVWVRGALPEAISFIFFPVIILQIENYLETAKKKYLFFVSLLFGLLIISHNLSVILFAPFLIIWIVFRFLQIKKIRPFIELAIAAIFSGFISSFYILPVIFESKFVDINSTTIGYFDWRIHFVTSFQIFASRFWGYGGSTWGSNDGLSLSVGQMQWIVPLIIFVIIFIKRKVNREVVVFFVLFFIGIFALFLTHNKSTFIWNNFSFMKYIQFPWRFLSIVIFSFALASGLIIKQIGKYKWVGVIVIIVMTIILNFNFFRPDIWYNVKDIELEQGDKWTESTFASIGDYWPNYGPVPHSQAVFETKDFKLIEKKSNSQIFQVNTFNKNISFPIAYFPGWEVNYNEQKLDIIPDKNGLVKVIIPKSEFASNNFVIFTFKNTLVRTIGNLVSISALIIWGVLFLRYKDENFSKK